MLIRARMRVGSAWNDVSILDISSRGLALHTADPPPRGSYLEVRRGRHVIVARVIWAKQQKLGVLSQDPLAIEAIISEPDSARARAAANAAPVERRRSARTPERAHERSRHRARMLQYAVLTLFGGSAAFFAFEAVHSALSTSLAKVEVALAAS